VAASTIPLTNVNMQENSTKSMISLIIIAPQDFRPKTVSMPLLHGGDKVAKTAEVEVSPTTTVELCSAGHSAEVFCWPRF
jgi:hypothetical protein